MDVNNLATTAAMNENGSPNDETIPPTKPSELANDQTLALLLQWQEANDQGITQFIAENEELQRLMDASLTFATQIPSNVVAHRNTNLHIATFAVHG